MSVQLTPLICLSHAVKLTIVGACCSVYRQSLEHKVKELVVNFGVN